MIAAGDVISDRYEIIDVLGRGGSGVVYRARDRKLEAEIALKLITKSDGDRGAQKSRFVRELKIARQITHPNVCRLYDVVDEEDRLFLTMELIPGETLDRRLRHGGPLSIAETKQIIGDVARGLAAVHEKGIVHRDVKPSNVLLAADGRAVLLDFGIARDSALSRTERLTEEGTIVGTPEYMAPERLEGQEGDARSDLYSLGIVAYEAVTGQAPHVSTTPALTIVNRLRNPVPKLTGVPADFEALLMTCLARDPRRRPQNATALLHLLAHGVPVRHTRRYLILGTAIAVAFAIGFALRSVQPHDAPELVRRARLDALLGSRWRATRLAQEAVKIDPDSPAGHLQIAATQELGDKEGEQAIARAWELREKATRAEQIEITLYRDYYQENYDGMFAAASELKDLLPDDPYIQARWGELLLDLEKIDEGVAVLEKSITRFPDHPGAYKVLANYYLGGITVPLRLPRWPERGRELAIRTTELAPNNAMPHALAALGELLAGDKNRAGVHAKTATQLEPENDRAAIAAITWHMAQGDRHGATQVARSMLDEKDARKHAVGAYLLGLLDHAQGRFERGDQRLAEAVKKAEERELWLAAAFASSRVRIAIHLRDAALLKSGIEDARRLMKDSFSGLPGDLVLAEAAAAFFANDLSRAAELRKEAENVLAAHIASGEADRVAGALNQSLLLAYAFADWSRVVENYRKLGDTETRASAVLVIAAEGLSFTGEIGRAIEMLEAFVRHPYSWDQPILSARARFLLGQAYEKQNNPARAAEHYQQLIAQWGEASRPLPEVREARDRLGALR